MLLASALTACHNVPQGPPPPDAEAIVAGTAGAGVRADTTDDPFTVGVDQAHWRLRQQGARERGSRYFWDAIGVLDVGTAERVASSIDERTFAVSLGTLLGGDPDAAAVGFAALQSETRDAALRSRARVGLTMALTWRSDWAGISRLGQDPDSSELANFDQRALQAGVERWARAFGAVQPAVLSVPDEPITLPLRRSAFGTPLVTVTVNGHPHEFWFDTGASMTIISADVALEAGIGLLSRDSLALSVVSGHIDARAVYIDSLAIGSMRVRGLSAAVVNSGVLRLDQRVVNGVTTPVPIAGVIGTDLIRYMDVVINAGDETITIRKPRPVKNAARNLFWVGYPIVRLVTRDGQPAVFGLDTGAEGSFITTTLLRKLPRTPVARRRNTLSGLGNEKEHTDWVARELKLSDGDYAIDLKNAPIAAERRWTFVDVDGVIGSDVALATRLHLDFTNGIFDVREGRPRDRGIEVKVSH